MDLVRVGQVEIERKKDLLVVFVRAPLLLLVVKSRYAPHPQRLPLQNQLALSHGPVNRSICRPIYKYISLFAE